MTQSHRINSGKVADAIMSSLKLSSMTSFSSSSPHQNFFNSLFFMKAIPSELRWKKSHVRHNSRMIILLYTLLLLHVVQARDHKIYEYAKYACSSCMHFEASPSLLQCTSVRAYYQHQFGATCLLSFWSAFLQIFGVVHSSFIQGTYIWNDIIHFSSDNKHALESITRYSDIDGRVAICIGLHKLPGKK